MGKLKVKDGTPVGNEHLCRGCSYGQFTVGYRETDVLVICTNATPARLVPFPVRECTGFWDRNRPDYEQMTKLALNITKTRRKPVRGFGDTGFAARPETPAAESAEAGEEESQVEEKEPALAG
jgi:hypothetical protein